MAPLKEGLDRLAQAVKLADGTFGPNGRRMTAVDVLIRETIDGDASLAAKDAAANDAAADAWEAVARDLARQVIDAEAEIAELEELNEAIEDYEDAEDGVDPASENLTTPVADRDFWVGVSCDLGNLLRDEQQAHCETYIEAIRLTNELNGWQDSEAAEYRKEAAGARLTDYTGARSRWKSGQKS